MRAAGPVAALIAGCLAVSGCSSGSDDGLLDLEPDDGPTAAEEPDPAPDLPDEPDPALFPSPPPPEPDPASPFAEDVQREVLEMHARMYVVTQEAIATNDASALPEVLHGELLEQVAGAVEAQVEQGVVSRSPDAEVAFVTVANVGSGPVEVVECRTFGPKTGFYDVGTGELVEGGRQGALRVTTRFELVEVEGELGYRAVTAEAHGGESCDELLE